MYKTLNCEIYGFMGNIGSGKNYIAENLFLPELKNKKSLVIAFADYLKISAICYENLEYYKVFGEKDEKTRNKLQQLGTELGRDKYGENIWCNILYNTMKMYNDRSIERFLITDVRFENEVNFIKSLGGKIIKIYAPDRNLLKLRKETDNDLKKIEEFSNHRSESFIRNFNDYDHILDNRINSDIKSQIEIIIKDCNY
jgi:hypothetical protein